MIIVSQCIDDFLTFDLIHCYPQWRIITTAMRTERKSRSNKEQLVLSETFDFPALENPMCIWMAAGGGEPCVRQSVQAFSSIRGTEATYCPLCLGSRNGLVHFEQATMIWDCSNTSNYALSQVALYGHASSNDPFQRLPKASALRTASLQQMWFFLNTSQGHRYAASQGEHCSVNCVCVGHGIGGSACGKCFDPHPLSSTGAASYRSSSFSLGCLCRLDECSQC